MSIRIEVAREMVAPGARCLRTYIEDEAPSYSESLHIYVAEKMLGRRFFWAAR